MTYTPQIIDNIAPGESLRSGATKINENFSAIEDIINPISSSIASVEESLVDIQESLPTYTKDITKTETGDLSVSDCSQTIINNYGQAAAMTLTLPAAQAELGFFLWFPQGVIPSTLKPGWVTNYILRG